MSEHSFEDSLQKYMDEIKDEKEMTEKQRQILAASVKLFATKGFHASSTAEIAKEAGVAEGTIFRHYKSKKDILTAVVAPVLVKIATPFIIKDVRKIYSEHEKKSFAEVIKILLKNRLALIDTNLKHLQIIIQEAFFHEELREALLQSAVKEARALTSQFITERIKTRELRELPPDVIVRSFFSMMFGMVFFKYVVDPDQYRERSEDEQIELAVDILLNGIANR